MDLQTAINSPFYRIRFIGFAHFALLVNAMISPGIPAAYSFYNILFMVALMWAVATRDSVDAIHTAAAINFSSFFFDLVIIITIFDRIYAWSAIFMIVNMAARPFSLILLHKELVDRGGDFVLVSVIPTNPNNAARTPRNYQDIDSRQSVPSSQSAQSNIGNMF